QQVALSSQLLAFLLVQLFLICIGSQDLVVDPDLEIKHQAVGFVVLRFLCHTFSSLCFGLVYCTCHQEIEGIGLLASLFSSLLGLTHLFAPADTAHRQQ